MSIRCETKTFSARPIFFLLDPGVLFELLCVDALFWPLWADESACKCPDVSCPGTACTKLAMLESDVFLAYDAPVYTALVRWLAAGDDAVALP